MYYFMNGIKYVKTSIKLTLDFILSLIKCIFVLFQCVGHISGAHLNPAITSAAVILGNKTLIMAGFYVVAQCLGSLLGFGLLKVNEYAYIHRFYSLQKHILKSRSGETRIISA